MYCSTNTTHSILLDHQYDQCISFPHITAIILVLFMILSYNQLHVREYYEEAYTNSMFFRVYSRSARGAIGLIFELCINIVTVPYIFAAKFDSLRISDSHIYIYIYIYTRTTTPLCVCVRVCVNV